ncbi:AAA family ATPase [Streptomyces sp. YC504]|uniref:AAA family ATPase n=1 Tax=Streptomyces mesophilus TaxID=1775132 RepID=A0A6G4XAR0_9ACTN|nr:AAA family ATPase [Streptomyces mesophilus]
MFRGRDDEVRRIDELLAAARDGVSGALLVHGEAGIGKTTLLDYAAARAADGMRVLRIEGVESETDLAFGGLHQLFLPALDLLDRLPDAQATALRAIFGLAGGAVHDRFVVGLAALSTLAEAAAERPVLCVIDDVQWLDQPSVDVLAFAARRLCAEGVVMLFGLRDGGGSGAGHTGRGSGSGDTGDASVTDDAPRFKGIPRLPLAGLDRQSAAALLTGLLPPVADRIAEQAQGNPLALRVLADALTLAQREGQLGPLALPDDVSPLPGRLQDLIAQRIGRLPAATRAVLTVAAADDTGELAVVVGAIGRFGGTVADLEPAEQAGIVRLSAAAVRFGHPLSRYAAYQSAPLARRIAAHQALAAALDSERHAHRRAWHLAAAATGPDEQVARELERVAAWAGSRQGAASASAAYERAAQLTADPHLRARRLIDAAQKASESGQDERCRRLADQVPLPLSDPASAADLARARAVVELGYGSPVRAARTLLACVDELGLVGGDTLGFAGSDPLGLADGDTSRFADRDTFGLVGSDTSGLAGADKMAPLLTEALHAALSAEDTGLLAEIAARAPHLPELAVAAWLFPIGAPDSPAAHPPPAGHDSPPPTGDDHMALLMAAHCAHLLADHPRAYEHATAAVARCRASGIGGWLPTALDLLARVETALGRTGHAQEHATEGLYLADSYDLDHRAAHLRSRLALLAAVQGREADVREQAEEALAYARPRGVGRATADALHALGLLELGLGRAESALAQLRAAARERAHPALAQHLLPDLVEAAVRAGRPDEAGEPAARLAAWAATVGQPALTALSHRCTALTGPDEQAAEHYTQALVLHEHGSAHDRARTALLYGEWLRRRRHNVEAREHLRTAMEIFARAGAAPWADRARAELEAAGEAHDPGTDTRIGRLSPQEREVVRLAATGATNREIATQLFLSPRTVGHHLYRAFPKLGVSSRTELSDLLES